MSKTLFTIGPTQMYETTRTVRQQDIPYFRNQSFSDIMLETDSLLKKHMKTSQDSKTVFLTASGTAGMEAAIENLFYEGDRVLVIVGGGFGRRFEQICKKKKLNCDGVYLETDQQLEFKDLEPFADIDYKALIVNLHETSTGQLYDITLLKKFCESRNMLLIVDAISTFLCDEYSMDANGIDVTIISTQKGLCVSPGMCMVVMNDRVVRDYLKSSGELPNMYFDFNDYLVNMERGQTPFTPAVGIVYEIHDMLLAVEKDSLESKLKEVEGRTRAFREAVISEGISIPKFRCSNAITTVIFDKPIAKAVEKELIETKGYVINPCGGEIGKYRFRVSHVGDLSIDDTVDLAETIKKLYKEM